MASPSPDFRRGGQPLREVYSHNIVELGFEPSSVGRAGPVVPARFFPKIPSLRPPNLALRTRSPRHQAASVLTATRPASGHLLRTTPHRVRKAHSLPLGGLNW